LDYYDEYKEKNPNAFIELFVIANKVSYERRKRLESHGISWKEIPESMFQGHIITDDKAFESISPKTVRKGQLLKNDYVLSSEKVMVAELRQA
jgi:uncharacterized DUF497 family protein